jgi:hypothetical protein
MSSANLRTDRKGVLAIGQIKICKEGSEKINQKLYTIDR